jgi:hypothetical protein
LEGAGTREVSFYLVGLCFTVVAGLRTDYVGVVETLDLPLLGCVHSRETWFRVLCYFGLDQITPQEEFPYFEWWLDIRKQVHKSVRKGFDSLALLVV